MTTDQEKNKVPSATCIAIVFTWHMIVSILKYEMTIATAVQADIETEF